MANKTIITRIKNKVDTLAKWNLYSGTLLDGEIAVVRVPTGEEYTNPVTGKKEPVVELLMKVGNGTAAFVDLPWMSAKASDVYNWAKLADPSAVTVKYNKGTESSQDWHSSSLADILKDLEALEGAVSELEAGVEGVRSSISVNPASAGDGVVHGITYDSTTGKFTVSYGLVQAADIAANAVTTAKIADANVTTAKLKDGAVTAGKIADSAVTDAKVAAGISSDKITIDNKTLTTKIGDMDADILISKNHAQSAHNYLPTSTKYALSDTVGGDALAAKKVNNTLTVQFNGTAQATFDGSAAKTVNVTPAAIGAASQEAVFGTNGLSTTVAQNSADIQENAEAIESLQEAIANGVDFIGVIAGTGAPTTATVTIKDGDSTKSVTAVKGDIVIFGTREFIWDGSKWEELGDATRVGNLEQKVKDLNTTVTNTVANTHKFVSEVTQSEGQITVTYTQPKAEDVSYGVSTVKAALDDLTANKSDKGHTHTISAGAEDDNVVVLEGTSGTDGVSYKATHAASGVTAGTYRSVTVDAKGHVTAGTNPTTISGYGITDAYTKTEVYKKSETYTKGEVDSELLKKADKADTYTKTEVNTAVSDAKTEAATDASNKVAVALAESQAYADGLNTAMDSRVDALETAKENADADFAEIKANYVRYSKVGNTDTYQMHLGTDTEVIIFDCGGADL